MILPDLAKRIAWYQDVMRPDSPDMGNGIADWKITAEYRPDLMVGAAQVWGCMCSPSSLPAIEALSAEDVAAKRAHIIVRTPTAQEDLAEVERTILHELGHVLVAPMQSTNAAAEENAMHSLDALFSKLSPEQRQVFTRAMQDPAARAYRAPNGETMAEENKGPEGGDKKPPEGEVKKQEGAPRDPAAIQADIVKAVLAGQPTDELAKELVAAQALAGAAAAAPASEPMPAAPTMGMRPEEAYARAKKGEEQAVKEGIEAVIDGRPDLADAQKEQIRKQPTVARARELAATYPRPAAPAPAAPTMGLKGHPSTVAGGGAALTVRARALQADDVVMARVRRSTSDEDTLGLHLDVPGHILAFSPSELLKEQFGAHKRALKKAQEGAAS